MLIIEAPAKLNLTLEVLGKRPDGFHKIRSVIQTISLFDRISLQLIRNVEFKCDLPNWSPEESLVLHTVNLLQEATECTKGVKIEINKRIPLVSGLGGDSSDAAATLRGLNRLWELDLPPETETTELFNQIRTTSSQVHKGQIQVLLSEQNQASWLDQILASPVQVA